MITIQEIIKQTNDYRYEQGLPALKTNPALMKAAQKRAEDMAKSGLFSHSNASGTKAWVPYIVNSGYKGGPAGENLAVLFNNATDTMAAWRKSPTHNQNLINPKYSEMGIAIVPGVYKGKKTEFIINLFSSPLATKAATKPIAKLATKSAAPVAPAKTYPYYPMTLQNANSTIPRAVEPRPALIR